MVKISQRITDEERLARYKPLHLSPEEEQELLEYDKAIDKQRSFEPLPYDLTPEQTKQAQKFARTGTRKAPTAYNFSKRERKPNATKGGIISELATFLSENSSFEVKDLEITNKERQISFSIGGNRFDLTLVQKRKPK